jgi:hypothetical protein
MRGKNNFSIFSHPISLTAKDDPNADVSDWIPEEALLA